MFKQVALIALLGISASAMAGPWQVKLGASVIAPTSDTTIAPGATVKADHEYSFTPSVEYFFEGTPFSAELLLATPINQTVLINGDSAGIKLKHLPPTVTAKYNFNNSTRFTPYVGIGGTALITWDESGVDKVGNDFGFAAQIGFNYKPADAKNWGVFVDARYADLSPKVTMNDGTTFDLNIDPMIYTLGYSYRF